MNPFALQTEAVSSITPAEDEEDYQDEIDITAKFSTSQSHASANSISSTLH